MYDDCYEIWAGCPAAESLANGIETSGIETDSSNITCNSSLEENDQPSTSTPEVSFDISRTVKSDGDIDIEPLKNKMKSKREDLSKLLSDRRNSKTTKQISFQEQMLTLSKEDMSVRKEEITLKRKLVEQYEESEKRFSQSMEQFSSAMSKTMAEGILMMQSMFQQSSSMVSSMTHTMQLQQQNFSNNWGAQTFQRQNEQFNQHFSFLQQHCDDTQETGTVRDAGDNV